MAAMGKGAALGGAIGSVIPGLGTVAGGAIGGVIGGIAGLFGSSKAKREAERQKRIAISRTAASNDQNREQAYTIGLRNEFNRENRTDTS
jgi:phage tail tape-measure protein